MKLFHISVLLFSLGVSWSSPSMSAWSDWWLTPEQKAARALENGDFETLEKNAPTADWRGVGEYGAGNFESAADTFAESAVNHKLEGDESAASDALYNQGVSQVRSGQYQEAIDSFGTVLEQDPDYADAEHNQSIAKQLLQLQQQQQQQQQSGEQDNNNSDDDQQNQQQQSEDGEQQSSDDGEQSQSDNGEPSESQNDEPSGNSDQQSGDSDQQPEDMDDDAENAEQDQLDAEQALAAEAAKDRQEDGQKEETALQQAVESPMSEADQAAEQLLRRIPDDPAGLLRRKLEQSHRSRYPEVGDATEPW